VAPVLGDIKKVRAEINLEGPGHRLQRLEKLGNNYLLANIMPPFLGRPLASTGKRLLGKKFILIAAFPKSGSTLLAATMAKLPGFGLGHLVHSYGRREQELEESRLWNTWVIRKNTVFQHHVRHSDHTESLLRRYPFHVVVLVRNLYDVCVSIYDHLSNDSTILPLAFCDSAILEELDVRELRFNFIVDLVIPWYLNFFVGWDQRANVEGTRIQWVYYEHLVSDQHRTIKSIVDEAGIDVADTGINSAITSDKFTRYNVGKIDRGKEMLMRYPSARDTIHRYCEYYPSVDFSRICPELDRES
jgi:hypothetical protein